MELLLGMPLLIGGLGLRPFVAAAAYVSGALAGRSVVLSRLSTSGRAADGALVSMMQAAAPAVMAAYAELERADRRVAPYRSPSAAGLLALDPSHPPSQRVLSGVLHEEQLLAWRAVSPPEEQVYRAGCSGAGAFEWLLAFPGQLSSEQRAQAEWPCLTFVTALQLRLGVPLSALLDAGFPADAETACWLRTRPPAAAAADPDDRDALVGSTTPSTQARSPSQAPPRCSNAHGNRLVDSRGRLILGCVAGGGATSAHDALAAVLARLAPVPGLGAFGPASTARKTQTAGRRGASPDAGTVGAIFSGLATVPAPRSGRWPAPDVYCCPSPWPPSQGRPVFLDVTVHQTATADTTKVGMDRLRTVAFQNADPLAEVDAALATQESRKRQHYRGCAIPGGPLAHAVFEPFAVEAGGRLGPAARALLRSWARAAAGDDPRSSALSVASATVLRTHLQHVSSTFHRLQASRILRAAAWWSEDHAVPPCLGLGLAALVPSLDGTRAFRDLGDLPASAFAAAERDLLAGAFAVV